MTANPTRRRTFLRATGAATVSGFFAGCIGSGDGSEEEYPSETIELVVPAGTGGGTDTYARELSTQLSEQVGFEVEVLNRPGAAQLRGPGLVHSADPDGHTIGAINLPSSVVAALVDEPDYDLQELEAVVGHAVGPIVIVANPELGFENDPEGLFEAYRNGELGEPGTIRLSTSHMALAGAGGVADLGLGDIIGYEDTSTVYRSVAAGEVPFGSGTATGAQSVVESGEVDIVCTLASSRAPQFPDTPAFVDDMGYENIDYVAQLTRGIIVHQDVPEERKQALTDAFETVLTSDAMESWSEETGRPITYMPPEEINGVFNDAFENIPEVIDLSEFEN